MAIVYNILFLGATLLFFITINYVNCDINTSHAKQTDDCKNVCRTNFKDRLELKSCVDKCITIPLSKNNGSEEEGCLKECIQKNPEGQALCEFKCKHIPKKQGEVFAVPTATPSKEDELEASQLFINFHQRVSKMMDCLMDGMKHQFNYGWANLPDMMDSRMDKFMGDANLFFKDPSAVKTIASAHLSMDGNEQVIGRNEGKVDQEIIPQFRPFLHRLIIIKKIPIFYEDNEEAAQTADLDMADSMAARFKNMLNNIFSSVKTKVYPENADNVEETNLMKSAESDVDKKKSNGKFCDFLSNLAHKSGLKRTTFILLMAFILLCFAWYCIATIINSKHRKEMYQEQLNKAIKGDLEYLVPIEEKFFFFAHLDEKEKSGEMVQAPSIPIKIKIQDV